MEQAVEFKRRFKVQIVHRRTKVITQTIDASSYEEAERVERGVNINLNTFTYRTRIVIERATA